jgi:hypothetical protein
MCHSEMTEPSIANYLNFGEILSKLKARNCQKTKMNGADNLLNMFKRGGFCVQRCESLPLILNFKYSVRVF